MKTFLEHLQDAVGGTFPIEDIINNLSADEIVEEVKLYALEACKESLRNASEKATLLIEVHETQSIRKGQLAYIADENDHFEVDKQSILSEGNIPKELL